MPHYQLQIEVYRNKSVFKKVLCDASRLAALHGGEAGLAVKYATYSCGYAAKTAE